jgi:serine/threonine protein kinase
MRWLTDTAVDRLRDQADLPDLSDVKYQVLEKLGSGGMGTVYLAEDLKLGRRVAVKVMNVADPSGELASRMVREAHIVALLEHPSIVPIHDVGTLEDGRVFYAMKLVQGKRLDEARGGMTSLPDKLRIFQKVCEAMAFAHARGVVHRDLKPENIMVGPFGEVLVMDWGVAKVLPPEVPPSDATTASNRTRLPEEQDLLETLPLDGSSVDTKSGTIIGTPAYMSPEQSQGRTEQIDSRSDVYALGAILYFLTTGRPPREASEPGEPRGDFESSPRRPRQLNPKLPRAVEAICLKAMSDRREDRYLGADEVGADVVRFLDGNPVSAYPENLFEKAGRWIGKNRFLVILIIAYLMMRLVVFFFVGR